MKHTYILSSLALLLVSLHCSSGSVAAQNQSTSGSLLYGGNTYSHKISAEDLADTPSWNPEQGDPPLSLRKALEIARGSLRRYKSKAEVMSVEKIELRQMGVEKWLYEVAFYCWKDVCEDKAGNGFRIYVKMDGSVIEPEITPETKQKK